MKKEEKLSQVVRAVRGYDVYGSPAWSDLDELSTHTTVEDIEVDPFGIVLDGDGFSGVANLYVSLLFGHDEQEGFREGDSFLARFSGSFDDDEAIIETFSVDTSSRFEPPEEAVNG